MTTRESNVPARIDAIAASLGLSPAQYEPMGWHKAKLAPDLAASLSHRPVGKYIGVTATSPTLFGEGKTVVAVGLSMALCRAGKRAIATIRQPSLAPVFGIKGGGTGGGRSQLLPAEDINLHFTGDIHAVGAANNLLAALIDNHVKRGLSPKVVPSSVTWRRALDVSDKALTRLRAGLDGGLAGPERETGFDLTAASEVMAALALAGDLADLHARLDAIRVGEDEGGGIVTAKDIRASGAMAALLRDAIRPNLVQTSEHTPALVHAGPFGNIAQGNSSVLADRIALRLADYVVTESGFGADCGAEKLFDIKCRAAGLVPSAEVLVTSARALKWHSGRFGTKPGPGTMQAIGRRDAAALAVGLANLEAHLAILREFRLPVVVAVNRFPEDFDDEMTFLCERARELGAVDAVAVDVFTRGGEGGMALAEAVMRAAERPNGFAPLYPLELPLAQKLECLATRLYGARGIELSPGASEKLARLEAQGFGKLPVCVAKTQYSLSHDPALLGRPRDFVFPIRDVRLYAGAGYVTALAGEISTMPGLPREPAAFRIDVTPEGEVTGLR